MPDKRDVISLPTVRPFSCGTQFGDWSESNCRRCKKNCDLVPVGEPPPCDIEAALLAAYVGDGMVTAEIARRMGMTEENEGCYVWPCGEWEPTEAWKEEYQRRKEASRA